MDPVDPKDVYSANQGVRGSPVGLRSSLVRQLIRALADRARFAWREGASVVVNGREKPGSGRPRPPSAPRGSPSSASWGPWTPNQRWRHSRTGPSKRSAGSTSSSARLAAPPIGALSTPSAGAASRDLPSQHVAGYRADPGRLAEVLVRTLVRSSPYRAGRRARPHRPWCPTPRPRPPSTP